MKAITLSLVIVLLVFTASYAQNSEEEKLRKELAAANERVTLAEANAKRAMDAALQSQKEAEISRHAAERAEAAAIRLRYICQAKLMAVKSLELGADPQQEALVALLAYKFSVQSNFNPDDADISKGLNVALTRFNDLVANDGNAQNMAAALCKHVNRNMTKEEWEHFAGSDLPYVVVCTK